MFNLLSRPRYKYFVPILTQSPPFLVSNEGLNRQHPEILVLFAYTETIFKAISSTARCDPNLLQNLFYLHGYKFKCYML
jgi:hypothetical protein